MLQRKTPASYHALAEPRGFQWLGPEVSNIQTKTGWQCSKGHRWEAPYSNICHQGSGCPTCGGRLPKTSADYYALAQERGFCWLGPLPSNTRAKTWWQCGEGHQWEGTYDRIQQGRGCRQCAGRLPKTSADFHALADKRGLLWLGPEAPNVGTKTWWQCREGHQWEARYNDIQQGTGCPVCQKRVPITAEQYHAAGATIGIHWTEKNVPKNTGILTSWECDRGHRWKASYGNVCYQGTGCKKCAGLEAKTPDDFYTLAENLGYEWLGPEVPNVRTKTEWRCREGHRWRADYTHIQGGRGCPECAIQRNADSRRLKEADYHALAARRNFRWVGNNVAQDARCKTVWICENGHSFSASYNNVDKGRGCPNCIDMVNGARVSKPQRRLCAMLDGELNLPCGGYLIDVAICVDNVNIAAEYDSWYWHSGREGYDEERDSALIAANWRILRIRSNELLPTQQQLDNAIGHLLAGDLRVEIVLDDWGDEGVPVFQGRR